MYNLSCRQIQTSVTFQFALAAVLLIYAVLFLKTSDVKKYFVKTTFAIELLHDARNSTAVSVEWRVAWCSALLEYRGRFVDEYLCSDKLMAL